MFRLSNNIPVKIVLVCICSALIISCQFIDLRPIAYRSKPDSQNIVLESLDTPVSVEFETEMKQEELEKILSVLVDKADVEGELRWAGNTVYFYPLGGWEPGTVYTLKLEGTIYAKDGREDTASLAINFFALSSGAAPYIVHFSPYDGESVGVSPETGGKLHLVFSKEMDKRSVEDECSIDGVSDKQFNWISGSQLEISSAHQLNAWTTYKWTLGKNAKSIEGIPITKIYSAQWTTDIDRILPRVKRVYPMLKSRKLNDSYNWIDTGAPIESGLGHEQGIGIEFTKDMDEKSAFSSVHIEPALSGRLESLSPKTIIFIPDKNPETGKTYRLTVSGDAKDRFGLKINNETTIVFIADIPFLKINSMRFNDISEKLFESDIKNRSFIQTKVIPASRELFVSINFSLPFTPKSMLEKPLQISLEPLFPGTLSPVSLIDIHWDSDFILNYTWAGLMPGDPPSPHYYKLIIPGGEAGITNGSGSYLQESISIFIEAAAQ
ncbi:MAG: Ig-like domain-containing protein [Spirochaetaceae bacterium]|jgi:hypothetical protein|nr:Ig-like domain-containing protein [Spirochaetaceae bacterium]